MSLDASIRTRPSTSSLPIPSALDAFGTSGTSPTLFPDLATIAIHGGLAPDPSTGAILTPIHQSTTYVQSAVGVHKGFTYTRSGNPTVAALERNLAAIEGAEQSVAYASGLAAITALFLAFLESGDHVLVTDVVYGGTVRLLRRVLAPLGVRASFVDTSSIDRVRAALEPRTRLILIETPANPTLKLTDIAAVAGLARERRIPLAVDNTFLTPALQRCLELGADVTVYSTTKYIEGHNATIGGALVARDPALIERFRFVSNTLGFPQSPFEAWLTLRGLKTLSLRVEQHSRNALEVARFLEQDPRVAGVAYPSSRASRSTSSRAGNNAPAAACSPSRSSAARRPASA
jgi:cystathionine beta-lyase/cystathionine gamma-synthase